MNPSRALAKESSYPSLANLADDGPAALVDRLRRGDVAALAQAYDLYHRPLRAFTQRLLGDPCAAEDLVQETFVALFRTIGNFDGTCSLKTFLLSVAANLARHHLRAGARRRAAMTRFQEHSADVPSLAGPDPEDEIGQHRLARYLSSLIERLPIDQRIAFVLCEVEERTSAEAATIVGVSQATVRSRVWLAKRKLRQALSREGAR
jgi:RNA polymerase sigma-70 factor (ECF subfamily)